MRPNPSITPEDLREVRITVLCRADEVADVTASLQDWFTGNDTVLWKREVVERPVTSVTPEEQAFFDDDDDNLYILE
jgi:hypothetical protein